MGKTMWRVRKGSQLVVGMTLRFGNVTYRIVSIEDGMVYVQHTLGLVPFDHFALGARQSYKVLVDETNTPIIH